MPVDAERLGETLLLLSFSFCERSVTDELLVGTTEMWRSDSLLMGCDSFIGADELDGTRAQSTCSSCTCDSERDIELERERAGDRELK